MYKDFNKYYTILYESNYAGYSEKARDGGSAFSLHDVSQDDYIKHA